jgi:pyridinium-3,5-bisthiocarboxylic acid mononucleotide nickel chelatase
MKTLYLDLFSGISGDMFLGALLDLGVDARQLERELKKLKLDGYHLHITRQLKSGIAGVKLDVHLADAHEHHHGHEHHVRSSAFRRQGPAKAGTPNNHDHDHHHAHGENRTFAEIKKLIGKSKLSAWVKKKSVAVFQRIAEAEGKIHGLPPERVHFHEVGAVDSIVDIVGACLALELLGKPRVLAGPVIEGTGWVDCAHGRFPVPAPATLAILGARSIGLTQCDEPHELVTPTGAALLAEFVESFGPMQNLTAEKIGFGLGTRENRTRPNVLRAVLGEALEFSLQAASGRKQATAWTPTRDWETDRVAVLETNLDDVSPEVLGHFVETALGAGALDVFYTPVQMKKNRPGVLLTVLCAEGDADQFSELILRETSAFGVRRTVAERRKLRREFTRVKTPFGEVVVKIGRLNGKVVRAAPEFESCKRLALRAKVPLLRIYEATLAAVKIGR